MTRETATTIAICVALVVGFAIGVSPVFSLHKDLENTRDQIEGLWEVIDVQTELIKAQRDSLKEYTDAEQIILDAGVDSASSRVLATYIVDFARAKGLDSRVVLAVAHTESRFKVNAVSEAGALGVLQVMPGIWGVEFEDECGYWYRGDARTNICIGVHILARNLSLTNDLRDALSMYYCGYPASKSRVGAAYADKVLALV
jgi:soluble lytic murein transglycosylase-like protein